MEMLNYQEQLSQRKKSEETISEETSQVSSSFLLIKQKKKIDSTETNLDNLFPCINRDPYVLWCFFNLYFFEMIKFQNLCENNTTSYKSSYAL